MLKLKFLRSLEDNGSNDMILAVDDGIAVTLDAPLTENLLGQIAADLESVTEITAAWNDDAGDLRLLQAFSKLKRLRITDYSMSDLEPLTSLTTLEQLFINRNPTLNVDFRNWPLLMELGFLCGDSSEFKHSEFAHGLRVLRVINWNRRDLRALSGLPNLRELELNGGKLETADGMQGLDGLDRLSLIGLTKLSDFEDIASATMLTSLRIDTCKRLCGLGPLSNLTRLRYLDLDNLGPIESLKPLLHIKSLQCLNFRESTNIIDGDTAVVQTLALKYAFQNRSHYNFTYKH